MKKGRPRKKYHKPINATFEEVVSAMVRSKKKTRRERKKR